MCSFLLPAAAFSKRRQHLSEARNCRCPQRISPQGKNLQVFTFCCYFLRQEIPAISSFMACTAKSLQLFLVAGKKLLQRRHMPWRAKTCYAALKLAKGFLQLGLLSFSCLQPSRLCKKTLQMHSEAGQARTCYAASLSGWKLASTFFCNVCTSLMADLTFEKWIIFIFIIGMLCLSFIIHALMKGKLTFILWIIMTASNPSLSKSIIEDPMCTNLPSSCKSFKPAKEYLYKISNSFFVIFNYQNSLIYFINPLQLQFQTLSNQFEFKWVSLTYLSKLMKNP